MEPKRCWELLSFMPLAVCAPPLPLCSPPLLLLLRDQPAHLSFAVCDTLTRSSIMRASLIAGVTVALVLLGCSGVESRAHRAVRMSAAALPAASTVAPAAAAATCGFDVLDFR